MMRRLLNVRVLAVAAAIVVIAVIGWYWYRGSSLVKIKHVTVTGLSGPDVPQIREALTQAALTMTTLNLSMDKLTASVQRYPEVNSLAATTHGSHAVTIEVMEKIPLATVSGSLIDGGGYVLPSDVSPHQSLPQLQPVGPAGAYTGADGQITGASNLAVLKVLGEAPYAFLAHVQSARYTSANGVELQVRNGPTLYFGPAKELAKKWDAVLAVLRNSGSAGASYINVIDPQLPAAGTGTAASGG